MGTIAVLMTCHNRREKSLECLRALYRNELPSHHSLHVYLVDDASTDGTPEAVSGEFPDVHVIAGDGTLYWAGGMRVAFDAAMADEHDSYLWLNDDTILYPTAIQNLLSTYNEVTGPSRDHTIVIGSTRDGTTARLTYGGYARSSRWHPLRLRMLEPGDTPIPCDTFNGNCLLVPSHVAALVGNLDPGFSHSYGDIDYGFRARRSGCTLWVAPGFVGTCSRNPQEGTWEDRALPVRERWKRVRSPKGLPPREWRIVLKRQSPILWPVYLTFPYIRLALGSLARRLQRSESPAAHHQNGTQDSRTRDAFIVWRAYQGRVDAMQDFFGFQISHFGLRFRHRGLRWLEYILKAASTLSLLIRRRPHNLWVQIPPTPLLYVAVVARRLHLCRYIVADCHNSITWTPWVRTPFLRRLLARSVDIVLVHNEMVLNEIIELGFDPTNCYVLEDRPAVPPDRDVVMNGPSKAPSVLIASSFDPDEPIDELLEAARRLPGVTFYLTGDPSRAQGIHRLEAIPDNVVFTGWLETADYKGLLRSVNLVLGLTTREDIQLSAAGEAVGYGKAMVLSDTAMLRRLYPNGVVHTGNDAESLAASIPRALKQQRELETGVRRLRTEREEHWRGQAQPVLQTLGGRRDGNADADSEHRLLGK